MSLARRVNSYISVRHPDAVCDACISRSLQSSIQQVNRVTIALATTSDFDRRMGLCADCAKEVKVIRVSP